MGSDSLIKLLDHISKDRKQKALVFRVLSPGGSAIASDLICRKLEEISGTRPVIISMSDVAASGGYLISLGGHKIIADSMTITGSIGIVSGKFDVSGLYDKLGISKEYVLKAKNAMMFSPSKGFSKDEESKLLEIMQYYYHQFVSKVSLARKMDFDQAEKISRGRVWTGRQAKGIGLIDDIGGLDTAISVAKNEAGISENQIPILKFYSESRGIKLSALLNGSYVIDQFTDIFNSLDSLINENILTILPFNIRIR
jgi:protease-4